MTQSIPLYQIDAFTQDVFAGNPAAVCPLDDWLDDKVLQQIARENNLSETAFVVANTGGKTDYKLRWFTPTFEIDLCGHATLATAWVLFHELGEDKVEISFQTEQRGVLTVVRGDGGLISMDFPAMAPRPAPHHMRLEQAIGGPAREFWTAPNGMHMAVLSRADDIHDIRPSMAAIAEMGDKGLIVTAQAEGEGGVDFISRYFTPKEGIAEDPVTGAAHCVLAPYWAKRLKKDQLHGRQVSKRGGDVFCEVSEKRVKLSGYAVLYLKGEIIL
ncbi:PhzF family phenazine biosynthesis protein [Magnetovibrio sp. PR-2]|uniref:PhzF family phenazine biosynthesis protein n=1 Tax=Magnetovibrio sp. PR-2 TaxID=3120356 RepID=UPI002FCE047C